MYDYLMKVIIKITAISTDFIPVQGGFAQKFKEKGW
jgi:hypothetical protein